MTELINSLKNVSGKISASGLTGYEVKLKNILVFDSYASGYFIDLINKDFQKYSIEAAYQYKIIQRLTQCRDLKSISESKISDFYIGMGDYFYKTIPELILGNLLFFNGIEFSFNESYKGFIRFSPEKTTTFVLPDVGVVIDLKVDMSGCNDIVNLDCRYQEVNPFNPLNEYLNSFSITGDFTLEKLVRMMYLTLAEYDVLINEDTLDLAILAPDVSDGFASMQPEFTPCLRLMV